MEDPKVSEVTSILIPYWFVTRAESESARGHIGRHLEFNTQMTTLNHQHPASTTFLIHSFMHAFIMRTYQTAGISVLKSQYWINSFEAELCWLWTSMCVQLCRCSFSPDHYVVRMWDAGPCTFLKDAEETLISTKGRHWNLYSLVQKVTNTKWFSSIYRMDRISINQVC